MKFLRLLAALFAFSVPSSAMAQSPCPTIAYGVVLTPAQWNNCFAMKQDTLGFTAINVAGGTMTGRLATAASTTSRAGFAILPGVAPTSPVDGDMWITSAGIFVRVNGSTNSFAATFAGTSPIQYTNPGGVNTFACSTCATGPASATDGAIATYNGTGGKTLRNNSAATIDASGNIATTGTLSAASSTLSGAVSAATVAGSMVASKAQQQTGSSAANVVTPLHQQDHDSAVKAWGYFDNSATILASYNIASVTKPTAGRWTVTFTTAFASANYACSVVANGTSGGVIGTVSSQVAGSFNANTLNLSGVGADPTTGVFIACMGRQ